MNDPRETPFNGRVAHASLKGVVKAESFTDGVSMRVLTPVAPIMRAPGGARERELLLGEEFVVLERLDGWGFGYAARDGYCGYVSEVDLGESPDPTHRIIAARSAAVLQPDVKATGDEVVLSHGSLLTVTDLGPRWAKIDALGGPRFLPVAHLAPIDNREGDPAAVAERFLGTPYLWGGNSGHGIDCSGLVQAAALACCIPCPGDSDQQARAFGGAPLDAPYTRNDLLFWTGHVALVVDDTTLIHANAHHMAVAYEPIEVAIARIEAQGDGPVTARGALQLL